MFLLYNTDHVKDIPELYVIDYLSQNRPQLTTWTEYYTKYFKRLLVFESNKLNKLCVSIEHTEKLIILTLILMTKLSCKIINDFAHRNNPIVCSMRYIQKYKVLCISYSAIQDILMSILVLFYLFQMNLIVDLNMWIALQWLVMFGCQ